MKKRLQPQILIFDVDGVLVDVRGTYWRSALETVRYITGKRVTYAELHKWKSKPGFNDDWNMVSAWVTALGRPASYEEARAAVERSSPSIPALKTHSSAGPPRNIFEPSSPWTTRKRSRSPKACKEFSANAIPRARSTWVIILTMHSPRRTPVFRSWPSLLEVNMAIASGPHASASSARSLCFLAQRTSIAG